MPTTDRPPPPPPCLECEWEAIRSIPSGVFVRWSLSEPCADHWEERRHAQQ